MKEFWNTIQLVFAGIGGWLGYFLRLEATMQENISTSIPASSTPKPIQQTDIEQDYNIFQAQKIAKNMLELGLISLSEFNKLTEINRKTFSPFWVEIMPKIP